MTEETQPVPNDSSDRKKTGLTKAELTEMFRQAWKRAGLDPDRVISDDHHSSKQSRRTKVIFIRTNPMRRTKFSDQSKEEHGSSKEE